LSTSAGPRHGKDDASHPSTSGRGAQRQPGTPAGPGQEKGAASSAGSGAGAASVQGPRHANDASGNTLLPHEVAAGGMSEREILKMLGGYLLAKDQPEFRRRIAGALALLLASKGLSVQVGDR
jgi:hypothetical protein